ncbi:monosaccharide-sensing protein 2-like [Punica granatum]|uniref:Monosaccharide-sensing protein 2-like n=1 Tax=Punica granatum TaxID=22663 RepID=A0A6P8EBM8_PUNGR|nr:monosaccharide-sensing protein 2-like [Punica granatum]XP_031402776.1 monosaccharide-sensing protein 2-like [Punica granatum]XP_031402777.1 monosaccharide-sensing protein 2-like [Punica granatum]
MNGAVLVAIVATVGNLLQGWDNATIAGAVLYIKKEFKLETAPTIEGLIVAMSLIGATAITTFSGPVSDSVGRRPMLIASSLFYFTSGLVMLWAPNVYILLLARLLDGFGIGLAVTLVPVYISETAPPEIRGSLNTLPQFMGSGGMFFSYCMVFSMSLLDSPSWRLMLGVLSIPSLIYIALSLFFLPESPRWLVSKGRLAEASRVLQKLRGREDVSGELALLIEGLGAGNKASLEEYMIVPADDMTDLKETGSEADERHQSWIAKPVTGAHSSLISRHGSMMSQGILAQVDPLVTLFGSIHEKMPETGSMLFPSMGSMLGLTTENTPKNDHSDDESQKGNHDSHIEVGADSDDNLRCPLLTRQAQSGQAGSMVGGEQVSGVEIGGGWQLAYNRNEDGRTERIYFHPEGGPGAMSRRGSVISISGDNLADEGEFVHAAALVSQSALCSNEVLLGKVPTMTYIPETPTSGPGWSDLFEPGVKRALLVGIGIQILQQFSGINGVLYYTPQILEQAGVGVLLSNLGLRADSASLLISGLTTLLMLPAIIVAMRLMDVSGRRSLLLSTIPVLILTLLVLVFGSIVNLGSVVSAAISTTSVILYFCFFVMGFGPIPNILCAEIFPTRVRGICIALCALTFWICDIIVTYSLPVMLSSFGLSGVFGIYAVVCILSWVFIFLKVPETKGMPLEVISEFFAVGAKQEA